MAILLFHIISNTAYACQYIVYEFVAKTKHYVLFCFEKLNISRTKWRFMLDIKGFMRYNLIDKKEKETMLFVDGLSVYARYLHGGGAIVSDVHFALATGRALP